MAMRTVCISGWGQPHDALAAVAPDAAHVGYAQHASVDRATDEIAGAAGELVIGWSQGGQLAVRAIAEGKMKPKKLVLIGVPFQFVKLPGKPLGLPRDIHAQFRDNFAADPRRALARAWELIALDDANHDTVRSYLKKHDCEAVLAHDWLSWLDRLDGFSCADVSFDHFPDTLIVHGERDAVIWPEQAKRFAKAMPQARLELWKDCGHAPHWHDTTRMKKSIGEFAGV